MNGSEKIRVSLAGTENNTESANLLDDLNTALSNAGLGSRLVAIELGGRLAIGPTAGSDVVAVEIYAVEGSETPLEQLGYVVGDFIGQAVLIGQDTIPQIDAENAVTAIGAAGTLNLIVNGTNVSLTITAGNSSLDDLIDALNTELAATGFADGDLSDLLSFVRLGSIVRLTGVGGEDLQTLSIQQSSYGDNLGFVIDAGQTASSVFVSGVLPTDGRLVDGDGNSLADVVFEISINGGLLRRITVTAESTLDNSTAEDLIVDIQNAFEEAEIGNQVRAELFNGRLRFVTTAGGARASIVVQLEETNTARTALHILNNQTALSSLLITSNLILQNLTIDNADDADWYSFTLAEAPGAGAMVRLSSASPRDGLGLAIFPAGGDEPFDQDASPDTINPDKVDLDGGNNTVDQAFELALIDTYAKVFGLTLDTASDIDYFKFTLDENGTASDRLTLLRIDSDETLTFALFDGQGNEILGADGEPLGLDSDPTTYRFEHSTSPEASTVAFILDGLEAGDYVIRVTGNGASEYEIITGIGEVGSLQRDLSGQDETGISLAGLEAGVPYLLRVDSPNLVPTIYTPSFELGLPGDPLTQDMATRPDQARRDVIIGGFGNDRLQGGAGEDWIFGIAGSNVISGGYDQGAQDLLFGGIGNDTFQIMPDSLPIIEATGETFIPTFNDIMIGGEGENRILFLGGDVDNLGREVPDVASTRFNPLLQRWEFTAQVWDTANQEFVTGELPGSVVTAGSSVGSSLSAGRLGSTDLVFQIVLGKVHQTLRHMKSR